MNLTIAIRADSEADDFQYERQTGRVGPRDRKRRSGGQFDALVD